LFVELAQRDWISRSPLQSRERVLADDSPSLPTIMCPAQKFQAGFAIEKQKRNCSKAAQNFVDILTSFVCRIFVSVR
jgi:hypothetical protein